VPQRGPSARSRFVKLGHRRYLVISIAMVAAALDVDETGRIAWAGVAVGACSAAARRLPALEAALLGSPRAALADTAARALRDPAALGPLAPIDDVRGTARYRLDAAGTLVARALGGLAS
jgi:CO/xanthine dehydrogenase FAD-binding subunit